MFDKLSGLLEKYLPHGLAHVWIVHHDEVPALAVGAGRRPAPAIDDPVERLARDRPPGFELASAAASLNDAPEVLLCCPWVIF